MADEELSHLRPAQENQVKLIEELREKLRIAQRAESKEARDRTMNNIAKMQQRLQVTARLQACVRGWLYRRRVVAAMRAKSVQTSLISDKMPGLLRRQLHDLQHEVHGLQYRAEDRVDASLKLQAWWRAIVARRVVKLAQLSRALQVLVQRMEAAAIVVQAWFRGTTTKLRLRGEIQARIAATKHLQYLEIEVALKCIIQIQRGYRAKLAKRLVYHKFLESELADKIPPRVAVVRERQLIDSWRPAGAPGAEAMGSGNHGVIIKSPPQHDWEVDKIEAVDLIPFYGASSEQAVRHQIGGPTALMMQQQLLGPSTMEGAEDAVLALADDVARGSFAESLGEPWDIYPSGLTPGFLPILDRDVWEKGGRAKSRENALRKRGISKSKGRKHSDCGVRPCTKILMQEPSNIEERVQTRQAQKVSDSAKDSSAIDCHPMFVNAPPLPATKAAAPGRSSRYVRVANVEDDEEGSWGRTIVEVAPTYRTERCPRGMEKYPEWPLEASTYSLKKYKPGEVSHERVWAIAASLAEQLPALTAG
jgi:hypothetical protein